MKVIARRSFVVIFAVSVTCLVLRYVGNYFYGYSGMMGFPDVLQFVCCIIQYLMFPLMLPAWFIVIIRRGDRSWASLITIAFLVWNALTWFMPRPSELIVFGLRDRVMKEYGVGKLRDFARDFDLLPLLSSYDSSWRKLYMRIDSPQTGLAQRYPFLTWSKFSPHSMGPSYIAERNGVVDVRWGGALWGHWGFSVALKGKSLEPPANSAATILKVSDDVYFVREWD